MSGPPFRAEVIGSLLRPRILKETATAIAAGKARPDDYRRAGARDRPGRGQAGGDRIQGRAPTASSAAPRGSASSSRGSTAFGSNLAVPLPRSRRAAAANGRPAWRRPSIHRRAPITPGRIPTPEEIHARRAAQGDAADAQRFPFLPLHRSHSIRRSHDQQRYFDDLVAVYRTGACRAGPGRLHLRADGRGAGARCCAIRWCASRPAPRAAIPTRCSTSMSASCVASSTEGRPGMTVGMHLCRGNFRSRWMASGGYEPASRRGCSTTFRSTSISWSTTASAPAISRRCATYRRDRKVVLGLVSSKTPAIEGRDDLRRRIDEAAAFVDLERLSLSSQCRLRQRRRRQHAGRGDAMGQARPDRRHGPCRVGYSLGEMS